MRKELFKIRLLSLAAFCGIAIALASCSSEENVQGGNKGPENSGDKTLTAFMAGAPESRTSMEYTTGAFFWEAGDYIYVQDDDNVWQKSSNAPTAKTAYFSFMVPGKFTDKTSYDVYYPGKGGTNDQVTIPAAQTQTAPNDTKHFGLSGDCGTATANKVPGKPQFTFTLDHQAAYLVFQPYTSNTILKDCYLTKIEVSSDDNITGTYTIDPTTGELKDGTGTGKQITLTTKGSGIHANGFPMNTTSPSAVINGAYMVIKPGLHRLKVRYWVRDLVSGTEGTITKTLSPFIYLKDYYYDMKADLNVRDYDGDHYYMWDAPSQFWAGYEWTKDLPGNQGQPTLYGHNGINYPKSPGDSRWFSITNSYGINEASWNHFKILPNANEMAWYAVKGDPRWDEDEVWTTMGHLRKGGMWFLKKSKIPNYSTEHAPDGTTDLRTNYSNIFNTSLKPSLPEASVAENYFYLPAFGSYHGGTLSEIGSSGYYWSSSGLYNADAQGTSYIATNLYFFSSMVFVNNNSRVYGHRAQPFSYFGDN